MITIIIIVLISLILIVLQLGIRISLNYKKIGLNFEGNLRIKLLNKITIFKKNYPEIEKENKEESDVKKDYAPYLKEIKPVIKPLITLIKSFLKSIKIYKLNNHIILGLDSYVDTAEYTGYLWAIFTSPNTLIEKCNLTVEPSFSEPILDGYGEIDIKINLFKLTCPLISFLLDKRVRNFIKLLLKGDSNEKTF